MDASFRFARGHLSDVAVASRQPYERRCYIERPRSSALIA
jgi:hypothetical protein